jgi:N-acyl-D-aspartate/D-glutamate deacylase
MAGTRDTLGAEVLDDFERLTQGATEERIERMALLLMELIDKIAGGESHSQALDLLEKWKSHSPALKLKIFHMQQGLR